MFDDIDTGGHIERQIKGHRLESAADQLAHAASDFEVDRPLADFVPTTLLTLPRLLMGSLLR